MLHYLCDATVKYISYNYSKHIKETARWYEFNNSHAWGMGNVTSNPNEYSSTKEH